MCKMELNDAIVELPYLEVKLIPRCQMEVPCRCRDTKKVECGTPSVGIIRGVYYCQIHFKDMLSTIRSRCKRYKLMAEVE